MGRDAGGEGAAAQKQCPTCSLPPPRHHFVILNPTPHPPLPKEAASLRQLVQGDTSADRRIRSQRDRQMAPRRFHVHESPQSSLMAPCGDAAKATSVLPSERRTLRTDKSTPSHSPERPAVSFVRPPSSGGNRSKRPVSETC